MYSTRIGDGSQSNFAVGNSQCHEPPMTGNGIFDGLYMFIPPIKMVIFLGDGLFLFYRTAFSLVNRPCFLSHPSSPMTASRTSWPRPLGTSRMAYANLVDGIICEWINGPYFFVNPPRERKVKSNYG